MSSSVEISREEYERIKELPVMSYFIDGEQKRGRFDEEKSYFFLVDDDDELTGQVVCIVPNSKTAPTQTTIDEVISKESKPESRLIRLIKRIAGGAPAKPASDTESETVKSSNKAEEPDTHDNAGKSKKTKIIAVVIAAVLVLAVIAAAVLLPGMSGGNETASDAQDRIYVVQITSDLIPGDIITEDIVSPAGISMETYNLSYISGSPLYRWDSIESLVGSYANQYIPSGLFLSFNNVSSTYVAASNPWTALVGEDMTYLNIPMTGEILNYGDKIELCIEKQTIGTLNIDVPLEDEYVAGMEHETTVEQRYLIDSYKLKDLVVCDLLSENGDSLHNLYSALINVPVGEQLSVITSKLESAAFDPSDLSVGYFVVAIPSEQAEILGNITLDNTKLSYTLIETPELTQTPASVYASEVRHVRDDVDRAFAAINDAAEPEEE